MRADCQGLRSLRRGFTLLETMLVSGLLTLLVVLSAEVWSGFGRSTADAVARSRIAQQADLAMASLTSDLAGCLANSEGRTGSIAQGQFVGRMQPGNAQLWLCFDGGPNPNGIADWGPPDTVISYQVQGNQLVRWDQTAGTCVTVATNVQQLQVLDLGGGQLQIQLTFQYRNLTRTYTWMARDP